MLAGYASDFCGMKLSPVACKAVKLLQIPWQGICRGINHFANLVGCWRDSLLMAKKEECSNQQPCRNRDVAGMTRCKA